MNNKIISILNESIETKNKIISDYGIIENISKSVSLILDTLNSGGRIYFCGNGGSAADAQHLAAEFSGRFYKDRKALPAEALHTNSSYLTAVANDYSYDVVYSRLIDGIGREEDLLIGLSTSGNSKNILQAFESAKNKKIKTIAMTGHSGGKMKDCCDILLAVPSIDTPRIQECHITIGHIICQLVEEGFFAKS